MMIKMKTNGLKIIGSVLFWSSLIVVLDGCSCLTVGSRQDKPFHAVSPSAMLQPTLTRTNGIAIGGALRSQTSSRANGGGVITASCKISSSKDNLGLVGFIDLFKMVKMHPDLVPALFMTSNPAVEKEVNDFFMDEKKRNDVILWARACKGGKDSNESSFYMPFSDLDEPSAGEYLPFVFTKDGVTGTLSYKTEGICMASDRRCLGK